MLEGRLGEARGKRWGQPCWVLGDWVCATRPSPGALPSWRQGPLTLNKAGACMPGGEHWAPAPQPRAALHHPWNVACLPSFCGWGNRGTGSRGHSEPMSTCCPASPHAVLMMEAAFHTRLPGLWALSCGWLGVSWGPWGFLVAAVGQDRGPGEGLTLQECLS